MESFAVFGKLWKEEPQGSLTESNSSNLSGTRSVSAVWWASSNSGGGRTVQKRNPG